MLMRDLFAVANLHVIINEKAVVLS